MCWETNHDVCKLAIYLLAAAEYEMGRTTREKVQHIKASCPDVYVRVGGPRLYPRPQNTSRSDRS